MPERSFVIRASTAGSPAPGYQHLSGGYRWRGVKDWTPGDPRFREDTPPYHRTTPDGSVDRAQRLAEFTAHREADIAVAEAGRLVGVAIKTARAYERARLAAIREPAS